jgi:hypothetical protein
MGVAQIYLTVFNRTLDSEKESLAALQRQLRWRYEEFLVEEGAPENTEKRQCAMGRVKASHLQDEYQRLCGELEAESTRRDQLLNKLAPRIDLKPQVGMYRVQQVTINAPCPPGTNARAYLTPIQETLGQYGFSSYVRVTDHHYELWANCPPWMMDAMDRITP